MRSLVRRYAVSTPIAMLAKCREAILNLLRVRVEGAFKQSERSRYRVSRAQRKYGSETAQIASTPV